MKNPRFQIAEKSRAEVLTAIEKVAQAKTGLLQLRNCGLSELPEEIRELTFLNKLDVSNNTIRELPEWLGELTSLQEIDLHSNNLVKIPASISQLLNLRRLDLWENPLEELSDGLFQLTELQHLLFRDNPVAVVDERIGSLVNLIELGIAGLKLDRVPEWVRLLSKLKALHLFKNRLTAIPSWIGELSNLESISAHRNNLSELPSSLLELKLLARLDVQENEPLRIPKEISEKNDARRILDYYFRASKPGAGQPLNEFKLILVGRGGVGKTTLAHRLTRDKYKRFKRTPGIKITKWEVNIDNDDVRAHVWDFGGQEIMHGTHRFFMTERALYLVLLSGREGTEDRDTEYWLSLVKSFAGDAPVVLLLNKWSDYPFEVNRELLREKYGRDLIFIETDSETGYGIKKLRECICREAKKLPGLKALWPVEWRRIREELSDEKRSWLTFADFCAFCETRGVTDPKSLEALAESLHDLGLVLAYRKEEALKGFGVLNPRWATKGIYEMLNSSLLRSASGKFDLRTFAAVLPRDEYPPQVHCFLVALMQKFRLCHPLDDRGEQYLVPELLTKEEPKVDKNFIAQECLNFVYRYDAVLPEGLLPRFIVETYVLREPKYAWRSGVILERANCRALVRGDIQGRTVTIRVAGIEPARRELLGIIREHFERIHKSYEKLPVTEMVPIPGFPDAHVKHDLLLKYEKANRDEIAVEVGEELKNLSVKELLDGVDAPGVLRGKAAQISNLFEHERMDTGDALSLCISYAHKDERYRDAFRGAITVYERRGELVVWDDTKILPGQAWEPEIMKNLARASIIVFLLSNDFIRSDYCIQKEVKVALERDSRAQCTIIPIVVRACQFSKLELGRLQAIVPNGKAIKQHRDRDAAWLEVTRQLELVMVELKKSGKANATVKST